MLPSRPQLAVVVPAIVLLVACRQPLGPDRSESAPLGGPALVPTTNLQAACQEQPEGVIAWWRGDGDPADAIGANHATPVGPVGYAPGRQGQAFALDGAGYLTVADAPALDLATSFTVDFWFEPRSSGSWFFEGLLGKRDPATEVANFGVNLNAAFLGVGPYYNDPLATGGDDFDQVGSAYEAIRVMPTPAPGAFHHFAAVYRQASPSEIELRMFIDGAMVRARTIGGSLARTVNDAPLTIGASYPGFETFTGLIDELRIFGRALSDDEVGALSGIGAVRCSATPVVIVVHPGRLPCQNPRVLVTVAVLSTGSFDATTLDPGSARFGPAGATEVHRDRLGAALSHREDVDRDGRLDLVLHFRLGETGLDCRATEATLLLADPAGAAYQGTGALEPAP